MKRSVVWRWLLIIKNIYSDLKFIFGKLPKITRFFIILTFKSTVVSFLLSVLAVPATATYAMRFGFRVPVEGTAYIQFAIGCWSFISFVASIAVMVLVVAAFGYFKLGYVEIQNYVNNRQEDIDVNPNIALTAIDMLIFVFNRPLVRFVETIGFFIKVTFHYIATTLFVFSIVVYMILSNGILGLHFSDNNMYYWSIGCMFLASIFSFGVWYAAAERPLWMLQGYLTAPLAILMAVALFSYDTYGSLLRVMRYGGGIETNITTDGKIYKNSEELIGNMLLRSNSSTFMLLDENIIMEISNSKIASYSAKYNAKWHLPKYGLVSQKNYIAIE